MSWAQRGKRCVRWGRERGLCTGNSMGTNGSREKPVVCRTFTAEAFPANSPRPRDTQTVRVTVSSMQASQQPHEERTMDTFFFFLEKGALDAVCFCGPKTPDRGTAGRLLLQERLAHLCRPSNTCADFQTHSLHGASDRETGGQPTNSVLDSSLGGSPMKVDAVKTPGVCDSLCC